MKSYTLRYTGENKSGLDESPQSDTIIFPFQILLDRKEFNIGVRVAGIAISQVGEQEILKNIYSLIGDIIFKHGEELENDAIYRLINHSLEKEK